MLSENQYFVVLSDRRKIMKKNMKVGGRTDHQIAGDLSYILLVICTFCMTLLYVSISFPQEKNVDLETAL